MLDLTKIDQFFLSMKGEDWPFGMFVNPSAEIYVDKHDETLNLAIWAT